jgi:anthranilate/para-aminobenzoate synthase component I
MVQRAQEYIAAGDIYQVNLSQRFCGPLLVHPLDFYLALRQRSPAPMAAFLDLPGQNRQVLCSSMETFLRMTGRRIMTKPIKGTRPRGATPAEDEGLRRELTQCCKERAELVMITDLLRNDLGRVCRFGSVEVEKLLQIEAYAQVYHQVSRISGLLREEVDHPEALRHCFPGGSITGAPKIRATQIIHELEPLPRGLYTGSIGFFGPNHTAAFNIVIRTLVNDVTAGFSHFHVGAGIVADSVPEREYRETLHKARGLLETAGQAQGFY